MNEPANFVLPDETFTVFEFALGPVPTGTLRQRVKSLGEFASVEEAFATASETAYGKARSISRNSASAGGEDGDAPVLIVATEFGYDVRRGYSTLSRFWVHARPAPTSA